MAKPVGFEGANMLFIGPPNSDIGDLETFYDGQQVVSAWRLSDEELDEVKRTGVVWLSVQTPRTPPVLVSGFPLVKIGDRNPKVEPIMKKAKKQ